MSAGEVTDEMGAAMDALLALDSTQRGRILCWFCPTCRDYVGAGKSPGVDCSCRSAERLTITRVIAIVAKHFGFAPEALTGPDRHRSTAYARHTAMWLARAMVIPRPSFPEIASAFGSRDHTTVMHAVKRVETADPINDPMIQKLVTQVREVEIQS